MAKRLAKGEALTLPFEVDLETTTDGDDSTTGEAALGVSIGSTSTEVSFLTSFGSSTFSSVTGAASASITALTSSPFSHKIASMQSTGAVEAS